MDSICRGASGAAVEDVQERLSRLGYEIDKAELEARVFGDSTANAVARFRLEQHLPLSEELDAATWALLVDEGYELGDRTLYLRLPNFHGADVRALQQYLNILGFSCGEPDGHFGAHTEAAVKLFQESVGLLPDGMAFQDTFDAIERLRHVWSNKNNALPTNAQPLGFARAAGVLELTPLSITGLDPIARNVAGRIFNLADATTERSSLELIGDESRARAESKAVFMLAATPLELPVAASAYHTANVSMDDLDTLPLRLRTAVEVSTSEQPHIRIELPVSAPHVGSFTTSDAQTYAVLLLDALCTAFDGSDL